MNTRFHVRSKVFGARRAKTAGPDGPGEAPRPEPGRRPARGSSTSTDALGPDTGEHPTGEHPAIVTGGDPIVIDTLLGEQAGRSSAYLIPGDNPAVIDPGAASSAARLVRALEDQGVDRLGWILLTHLHPGNASAAGYLAGCFPAAAIAIPAPASGGLADPSALAAETRSMFGDRGEELYGSPRPISRERIRALADGDLIDLGDRTLEVIATPGHTAAHVSYLDPGTGALFCGDALGIQVPGSGVFRPSTPPSGFSHEDSLASIDRLASRQPESVYLASFGEARQEPEEAFDAAADALDGWHRSFIDKRAQAESDEELSRQFNACLEATLEPVTPAVRRDFELINPTWLNLAGLKAERPDAPSPLSDAA